MIQILWFGHQKPCDVHLPHSSIILWVSLFWSTHSRWMGLSTNRLPGYHPLVYHHFPNWTAIKKAGVPDRPTKALHQNRLWPNLHKGITSKLSELCHAWCGLPRGNLVAGSHGFGPSTRLQKDVLSFQTRDDLRYLENPKCMCIYIIYKYIYIYI